MQQLTQMKVYIVTLPTRDAFKICISWNVIGKLVIEFQCHIYSYLISHSVLYAMQKFIFLIRSSSRCTCVWRWMSDFTLVDDMLSLHQLQKTSSTSPGNILLTASGPSRSRAASPAMWRPQNRTDKQTVYLVFYISLMTEIDFMVCCMNKCDTAVKSSRRERR